MFTQEMKKEITPQIKAILEKYGLKGSLSIPDRLKITLTISSGKIDFISDLLNTNRKRYTPPSREYYSDESVSRIQKDCHIQSLNYKTSLFTDEKILNFINETSDILNFKNYDRSKPEIDYFDINYYIGIDIGTFDKPYTLTI